jgi:hypothetical protein
LRGSFLGHTDPSAPATKINHMISTNRTLGSSQPSLGFSPAENRPAMNPSNSEALIASNTVVRGEQYLRSDGWNMREVPRLNLLIGRILRRRPLCTVDVTRPLHQNAPAKGFERNRDFSPMSLFCRLRAVSQVPLDPYELLLILLSKCGKPNCSALCLGAICL